MSARFLPFVLILLASVTGCASSADSYRHTSLAMGTYVEYIIPVGDHSRNALAHVCRSADRRIHEIEELCSFFSEDSVLARVNSAGKDTWITVPAEFVRISLLAKRMWERTGGAFDVTVAPYTRAWGFGPDSDAATLQKVPVASRHHGFADVHIDESRSSIMFSRPGIGFDFGGLAKGYAVDAVIALFRKHGIRNALVTIGGDLYCLGTRDGRRPWKVGIRNPDAHREITAVLTLSDKAVATSGDYENFIIREGTRYAHIIDPSTGAPADTGIHSATVLADTCGEADALATALVVTGQTRGLSIIEMIPRTECLMLSTSDNRPAGIASSRMHRFMEEGVDE